MNKKYIAGGIAFLIICGVWEIVKPKSITHTSAKIEQAYPQKVEHIQLPLILSSPLIAKLPPKMEKRINHLPEELKKFIRKNIDTDIMQELIKCKTLAEATVIINRDLGMGYTLEKVNRIVKKAHDDIMRVQGSLFNTFTDYKKLQIIGLYLTHVVKVEYDEKEGETPYSINHLLSTAKGNCATLPVYFTMIAESFNLPVTLVNIKDHQFARYIKNGKSINIEATSPYGMGIGTKDAFYINWRRPSKQNMLKGSTMRSLTRLEMYGSLYTTKLAYLSKVKNKTFNLMPIIANGLFLNPKCEYSHLNLLFLLKDSNDTNNIILKDEVRTSLASLGIVTKQMEEKLNGIIIGIKKRIKAMSVEQRKPKPNIISYHLAEIIKITESNNKHARQKYAREKNLKPGFMEREELATIESNESASDLFIKMKKRTDKNNIDMGISQDYIRRCNDIAKRIKYLKEYLPYMTVYGKNYVSELEAINEENKQLEIFELTK